MIPLTSHSARPDTLLLIGHGSQDADGVGEYFGFADILAARLGLRVEPCFLEFADPPIAQALEHCASRGDRNVVALPLFLGPAGHQKNDVPTVLNWARTQWPALTIRYGVPLGAQAPLVAAAADRVAEALSLAGVAPDARTAVIVVGRGSRDPDSNAEVARVARLLWEGRDYLLVEPAFYSLTRPDLATVIERCVRLGARRVVVLPYLLFTGRICVRIAGQTAAAQARYPDVELLVAPHLGHHEGIVAAVVQRYEAVLDGSAAMTCDLCKYRERMAGFEDEHGLPQGSDHHHGLRGVQNHGHSHGRRHSHGNRQHTHALDADFLPPRYRGGQAVSAAPMSAADLVYDAEGRVDWQRVWGGDDPDSPFCELALAGGPPHRGTLLEPAAPEAVVADPAGYARVVAELERGLALVSGLPVVTDCAAGWVGLVCAGDEMALWLLRAILVENICVRREGNILFLPAGPAFELKGEIKNVISALAKTHHYWQEHLQAGQP